MVGSACAVLYSIGAVGLGTPGWILCSAAGAVTAIVTAAVGAAFKT